MRLTQKPTLKPLTSWKQISEYFGQWVVLIRRLMYDLMLWGIIKLLLISKRNSVNNITHKQTTIKK
ncbi:MAG: hypothetical protein KBD73_03855 [Candidatus Magasanikbacteria bacterium]|nr:hypothetical protein [Candidatus Magasanikbacteria bacterium]